MAEAEGGIGLFSVPEGIDCPRAKSWMTPCIARDGKTAMEGHECVGCGITVWGALTKLGKVYEPAKGVRQVTKSPDAAADKLKELVAEYVETK